MDQTQSAELFEWNWNLVMGCQKESPGCEDCRAIEEVIRSIGPSRNLRACRDISELVRTWPDGTPDWTDYVQCNWDTLKDPLDLVASRICVAEYGDLFYPAVSEGFIRVAFEVMREALWHDFFILTKYSERLLDVGSRIDWPENVFVGVSVEDAHYSYRTQHLLRVNAKRKFLSFEPILGPNSCL